MEETDCGQFPSEGSFKSMAAGHATPQSRLTSSRPIRKSSIFMMRVFFVYGVGLIGVGLVWGIISLTYVTANEVNGTVIRVLQSTRGGQRPEVEYVIDGRRFVVSALWNSTSYRIGDPVRLFYKPNDPASARLGSFRELWLFPLAFNVVGMAFLLGRVILRHMFKYKPPGTSGPTK